MNSEHSWNPKKQATRRIVSQGRWLDISRPAIMYIVNLTEDSFSDGGRFDSVHQAIDAAMKAVDQGAHIIDLGAESTRPGAQDISADQQLQKILPVLKQLRQHKDLWISVDTSDAEVINQVLAQGADMINDVRSLTRPGAMQAIVDNQAAICLMHMQGQPNNMQSNPQYTNVLTEVESFLLTRVEQSVQAGINRQSIIIDPGFGFGKKLQDNLVLLDKLHIFTQHDLPVLAGLSRKSMFGTITGKQVHERATLSALAGLLALERGASILRVHDMEPTLDALSLHNALEDRKNTQ